MSVIMTVWVQGDPEKLEQYAAENGARSGRSPTGPRRPA